MPEVVKLGYFMNRLKPPEGDAPEISVNAVDFDGTNDYLDREGGLTGAVDNKLGLVSFWFNLQVDNGVETRFGGGSGARVLIIRRTDNKIEWEFREASSGLLAWSGRTTNTFVAAGGWNHFLLSFSAGTGQFPRKLYINDTLETVTNETFGDRVVDWLGVNFFIYSNNTTHLNAFCSEFYMTNEFLDLTEEANRRKFISVNGKPVDLGSDGSDPTGTAPLIYFSGATASWHANKGSGGGFTEVGALTDASSSPSD